MRGSLQDLGGRSQWVRSSLNLNNWYMSKLENADVVNKFKWRNKISENADYSFQNISAVHNYRITTQ